MVIAGCRIGLSTPTGKWVNALELLGAVLYLGASARESGTCWQDGINATCLPVVLVIVAAFAVRNGATQGARSGAALFWLVVPGISLILLAGIGEWKAPVVSEVNSASLWATVPLLLLPLLGDGMKDRKTGMFGVVMAIGIVGAAATLWLNGTQLPPNAANAFYEYSKGITLFGVAERFEAVSACLLTAGWFALFAFLLGSIFEIAEESRKGMGTWSVWCGGAVAVLVMYKLPISIEQAGVFCVISWGFLPLLTQAVEWLKKSKKCNKNY